MAMPEHNFYLVAGLGNPGRNYVRTRHNAGFMVVDALAARHDIEFEKNKFGTLFGRGRIQSADVILAKPQAFMNRSGPPLRQLADYFRIPCKALVVVHDDIDLAYERLKIKEKGGDGGHKGIKSVIEAFGGDQFVRLRVGVGRSGPGGDVVGHVLGRFDPEELSSLEGILHRAAEAIDTILCKGIKEGMNRYNQKPTPT